MFDVLLLYKSLICFLKHEMRKFSLQGSSNILINMIRKFSNTLTLPQNLVVYVSNYLLIKDCLKCVQNAITFL